MSLWRNADEQEGILRRIRALAKGKGRFRRFEGNRSEGERHKGRCKGNGAVHTESIQTAAS